MTELTVRRTPRPSLRREKALMREGSVLVAGCDEVGRGALAGPVTVGVVVVDAAIGRVPPGLADSKLLSPRRREALVPKIRRWSQWHAVGHASPDEIDQWGLTVALRLAGHRAMAAVGVQPDVVLLDGNQDWLSPRPEQAAMWQIDLTGPPAETADDTDAARQAATAPQEFPDWPECTVPRVVTQIKADVACASVAAASVLAKVTRDTIMTQLAGEHPHFAWDENKGYASDRHRAELRQRGPCEHHRRSWRLGCDDPERDRDDVGLSDDQIVVASTGAPPAHVLPS